MLKELLHNGIALRKPKAHAIQRDRSGEIVVRQSAQIAGNRMFCRGIGDDTLT